MKSLFSNLLKSLFLLTVVLSCTELFGQSSEEGEEKKKILVCSTTQIADFARQIVGDRWEVTSVLGAGADPHLYSVKTSDARLVAEADLCAHNGWHLEGKDWMKTLATDAQKPLVTCVDGIKPLQLEEDGRTVEDPHAWFRVKNAAQYVKNLLHGVSEIDPENAAEYTARAELYLSQLQMLDAWIFKQVTAIPRGRRVLVTSHDAFNYFCEQYGFKSASPVGWSTEELAGVTSEKRQQTIDSIRKFGVKSIFVETSVNDRLIRQIANDAGVAVGSPLYSDSMGKAGTAGATYIGMMRENVLNIVRGLE